MPVFQLDRLINCMLYSYFYNSLAYFHPKPFPRELPCREYRINAQWSPFYYLKECILAIHSHHFALERLLF